MKTICFLIVLFSTIGFTQTNNSVPGEISPINNNYDYPKHSIDLGISYWNNSKSGTSVRVPGVKIGTGGVSGKVMYNFYLDQNFAFNVSIGAMAAKVEAWAFHEHTSTVVPVMMGMKYYFAQPPQNNFFRPYVSGSMGLLIGTESSVEILSVKEHTESAIGVYAGVGSDFILGSLIKLHADIGYNLFSDFSEEIGSRKNYSGPEFSFGIGFMF
ncbi:MAG: outer membrane beta-barrel protein [Ignavibacteria bacterium]|nr:outer membrane beta-barrel protein [Ignavibacteria bacterium]